MSLLAQLSTDTSIKEDGDSLGSQVLDSGLYEATIKYAYIGSADSGAVSLVCMFDLSGRPLRQTFWMTSGTAKGGKNYYVNKDGERKYLPGFTQANSLAQLVTGKEISALDTETKVIKLWSKEAKAEVPTKVEMLMELVNQPVVIGVIKQLVNKTVKNDDGGYSPTDETREENEIDKFFKADNYMTLTEVKSNADEAEFYKSWVKKFKGTVKDRTSKDATKSTPKTSTGGASKKPAVSLFD